MYAQASRLATAGRLGLGRGRLPRIELPPVIHLYSILLSGNSHAQLMVAAVGPAIVDYVTRYLIERNLQLHQRFAWNTELRADPLQTISQGGELHQIVADDDFDAPSGGLWHGPDIATFSRKHLTRTGYHDGESAGRDFSQPCRLYCDNQGRRLTARAAASFTLRNRAR